MRTPLSAARRHAIENRHKVPQTDSGMDFADFADAAPATKKRKKSPGLGRKAFDRKRCATAVLLTNEEWDKFTATDMVMLYALLHSKVYGFLPLELLKDFRLSTYAAGHMLKDEFGGKPLRMINYIRWVWAAEKKSFARRAEDNTFRISWRYQFKGQKMLTDYRIHLSRRGRIK